MQKEKIRPNWALILFYTIGILNCIAIGYASGQIIDPDWQSYTFVAMIVIPASYICSWRLVHETTEHIDHEEKRNSTKPYCPEYDEFTNKQWVIHYNQIVEAHTIEKSTEHTLWIGKDETPIYNEWIHGIILPGQSDPDEIQVMREKYLTLCKQWKITPLPQKTLIIYPYNY